MQAISRVGLPALAFLLMSTVANAASVEFTDYVPGSTTGDFSTLNFSGMFTLQQFNPSLGTLTGVTLQYTSGWQNVSSSYTNNGGAGQARLSASFLSTLSGSTIGTLNTNPVLYDTGLQSVGGGATISVPPTAGTDGPTLVNISAPLSAFIGSGTLTYDLNGVLVVTNTFVGSFNGSQQAEGRGELRIIYTYDDLPGASVPEPSSIGLLGVGLMIAGMARRRLKKPYRG